MLMKDVVTRIVSSLFMGTVCYVFGIMMIETQVFPTIIDWDSVGLFLGVIYGGFKDELNTYLF